MYDARHNPSLHFWGVVFNAVVSRLVSCALLVVGQSLAVACQVIIQVRPHGASDGFSIAINKPRSYCTCTRYGGCGCEPQRH